MFTFQFAHNSKDPSESYKGNIERQWRNKTFIVLHYFLKTFKHILNNEQAHNV